VTTIRELVKKYQSRSETLASVSADEVLKDLNELSDSQTIDAINRCTSLDGDFGLESYKLLTGNTEISEAYNKRLKELSK
jgi:hypothetical protein